MTPARLLMWDIDQTLCETRPIGSESFRAAFHALTRGTFTDLPDLAGRTDRHTCARALAGQGIADPEPYFEKFFTLLEAEFLARRHLLPGTRGPMPGVPQVLAALAADPTLVQTVVTGNIAVIARAKVAAFGLDRYLDFSIGGYGSDDQVRAALVRLSRERAEVRYGAPFADVLVIGDTPHDIEAALVNGVRAIGIATGRTSSADLRTAGAHAVLDSLADVPAAVALLTG